MYSWYCLGSPPSCQDGGWPSQRSNRPGTTAHSLQAQSLQILEQGLLRSGSRWCLVQLGFRSRWCFSGSDKIFTFPFKRMTYHVTLKLKQVWWHRVSLYLGAWGTWLGNYLQQCINQAGRKCIILCQGCATIWPLQTCPEPGENFTPPVCQTNKCEKMAILK